MNFIEKYFEYLSANPEQISENIKWTICTFILWLIMWVFRKEMLKGLEGTNLLFEGSEQVVFLALWAFPPVIFHLLFYTGASKGLALWALGFEGFLIGFAIAGSKIFDYAMSTLKYIRGGNTPEPLPTPVQTSEKPQ